MLFRDREGNVLTAQDIDLLSPWEVEEKGVHFLGES